MREGKEVIITSGLVYDDEDDDIYLKIEVEGEGEEPEEWRMQRHEVLELIKALMVALKWLAEEEA